MTTQRRIQIARLHASFTEFVVVSSLMTTLIICAMTSFSSITSSSSFHNLTSRVVILSFSHRSSHPHLTATCSNSHSTFSYFDLIFVVLSIFLKLSSALISMQFVLSGNNTRPSHRLSARRLIVHIIVVALVSLNSLLVICFSRISLIVILLASDSASHLRTSAAFRIFFW